MSWSNFLLKASFKGFDFEFNILDEEFSGSKALSMHEYPYVDGAHVEDMGRKVRNTKMNILLAGDNYERRLQQLIPLLEARGSGELIHPIYGSMPNMIASNWDVKHTAEEVDACRISVEFVEDTPNAPFFDRSLSLGFADKIANQVDKLKGGAFSNFTSWIDTISGYKNEISNIAFVVNSAFSYAANLLDTVVTGTLDLINTPRTILSDFASIFGRISTIGTWSTATTVSDWRGVVKQADAVTSLPGQINTGELTTGTGQALVQQPVTEESLKQIEVIFDLNSVAELAENASDIFVDELDEPTLTPSEVETIVSDVRDHIQNTIEKIRNTDSYQNAPETIDELRDLGLSLQEQAEAVIDQRPPLVHKTVEAAANLHLIAFRWYGDYNRASELLRLNPQIKHESFIRSGEVLNAYAK